MTPRSPRLLLLALCVGCTGTIDGQAPSASEPPPAPPTARPPAGDPPPPATSPPPAGTTPPAPEAPSVMRRLTRAEYDATVRDLLGDDTRPSRDLPPDELGFGFDTNARALNVSPARAEAYLLAAEGIASRAVARLPQLAPCAAKPDAACAVSFVADLGKRAYRRPLAADEQARLAALFAKGEAQGGFAGGASLVLRALLVSAPFLYLVEHGSVSGTVARLTSWEMASRLSYTLWGTMPDAPLFSAAEADALRTPAQLRAAAERMLRDPRARVVTARFHAQWLRAGELDDLEKSKAAFPKWDPSLPAAYRQELDRFVDEAAWGVGGLLTTLFTAREVHVTPKLAAVYGVTPPPGTAPAKIALEPERRGGVLTLASMMAVLAHPNQTAPTLRGKFVLEQLLCRPPPPPPPGVNNAIPEPDPASTTRERLAVHGSDPACAGCHEIMDPIGYALESYDGIGAWRDREAGRPIDLAGEARGTDLGRFVGGVQLGQRLAASELARACVARQWFRYAMGREEHAQDAPVLDRVTAALAAGGGAEALVLALVETDAFRTRIVDKGGAP